MLFNFLNNSELYIIINKMSERLSERSIIKYPSRDAKPHDVQICSLDLKFPAHKIMIGSYPYFAGMLDSLVLSECNDISLPFAGSIVDKLLDLIYGKPWTTRGKEDDLFRILDYVGIYNEQWFWTIMKKESYKNAVHYLQLYGKPKLIDDLGKNYARKFLDYGDNYKEFGIYLCCVNDAEFDKILTNGMDFNHIILRYVCTIDLPESNKLKKLLDESNDNLPDYECLKNINNYEKRASSGLRRKFTPILNSFTKLSIDNFHSDSEAEFYERSPTYNCWNHDDGW